MTYLVERLAELHRHLDHLRNLRPQVAGPASLEQDLLSVFAIFVRHLLSEEDDRDATADGQA